MPEIADYVVIRDSPFDIVSGGDSGALSFKVHSDLLGNRNAILAYKARPPVTPIPGNVPPFPQGFAGQVKLLIEINGGEPIETVTISDDTVRGLNISAEDADMFSLASTVLP